MLFIDHHDSFSWNLIAQLRGLGAGVRVVQSEQPIEVKGGETVVLSPGPGAPTDYPHTLDAYQRARAAGCPVIGVCLGFQVMMAAEGQAIGRQAKVLHGVQTAAQYLTDCRTYAGLVPPLLVARYHSLCLETTALPAPWRVTAWDAETGVVLSAEHSQSPLFAFQFHPDSFLTPEGDAILGNVLQACAAVEREIAR